MSANPEITREQIRARRGRAAYQTAGLVLGPALAGAMMALPVPDGLTAAGWRAAALGMDGGLVGDRGVAGGKYR